MSEDKSETQNVAFAEDAQYEAIVIKLKALIQQYRNSSPGASKNQDMLGALEEILTGSATPKNKVINFYVYIAPYMEIDTDTKKSKISLADPSPDYLKFIIGIITVFATVLALPTLIPLPLIGIIETETGRHPRDLFNNYAETLEKEINLVKNNQLSREGKNAITQALSQFGLYHQIQPEAALSEQKPTEPPDSTATETP